MNKANEQTTCPSWIFYRGNRRNNQEQTTYPSFCQLNKMDAIWFLHQKELLNEWNKQFAEIKNKPEVKEFIKKNENNLFGDIVNGNTNDEAIDILLQVHTLVYVEKVGFNGFTTNTEELNVNFFYSHNGDNKMIESFSCSELCNLMGIHK